MIAVRNRSDGVDLGTKQNIEGTTSEIVAEIIRRAERYMSEEVLIKDEYRTARKTCRLRHKLCAFWASIGECDGNAVYMRENCAPVCRACGEPGSLADAAGPPRPKFDWDSLLRSREPVVANGNVWPPSSAEERNDSCLLLLSHSRVMRHCPSAGPDGETLVLREEVDQRFRGAFSAAAGTDRRRLWLLTSPYDRNGKLDILQELDVPTGEIVQVLTVPHSIDGHDAVRVGNRVFIVDTRHGDVIEIALPASAAPYAESSVKMGGAIAPAEAGVATLIRRHSGYTRADHINAVAVHPEVLLLGVHGGSAGNKRMKQPSKTRLSALARSEETGDEGRELSLERDGFATVDNAGTMCHGIAFWEELSPDGEGGESKIKLITLDSMHGSLVSVVLSGPGSSTHEREVLWSPDPSHPVLTPPEGSAGAYHGSVVFTKGLAVQGDVAYFVASYARAPPLRRTIPYSLFIAVNLTTRKEIFARKIRSNGLINHVVTESYLGHPIRVVPPMMLHSHRNNDKAKAIEEIQAHSSSLDDEVSAIASQYIVDATVTFPRTNERFCPDEYGRTPHLSLEDKQMTGKGGEISEIDSHLHRVVMPLCTLDVDAIAQRLHDMGDDAFSQEGQVSNAKITNRAANLHTFKPGVDDIHLVFSARNGRDVYHFPWLDDWLPLLQSAVLDPLRIDLQNVVRMQFANMTVGSAIHPHSDQGPWVGLTHRTHVPITTHEDIFFLSMFGNRVGKKGPRPGSKPETMRIKAGPGDVFEFNNAVTHAVANRGGNRVHLIIDWAETPASSVKRLKIGEVCRYEGSTNSLHCDSD